MGISKLESSEEVKPIKGSIKNIRTASDIFGCYGFIENENGGKDIFFDVTSLSSYNPANIDAEKLTEEFSKLSKGARVLFNTKPGRKGEVACNLIVDYCNDVGVQNTNTENQLSEEALSLMKSTSDRINTLV